MSSCFRKYFIEHPESVGENYLTHGYKAAVFGAKLISFGFAEILHALIPGIDLFKISGSKSYIEIKKLCDELKNRNIN